VRDPAIVRAVEEMRRRRSGPDDLIVFRGREGWHDVRSDDVNAYIQEQIGERFSAKDFRTWHGTVLAAVELAALGAPKSCAGGERAIKEAVGRVAEVLGNTPAVCRSSYIDPRVFDRFRQGETIPLPARLNGSLSQEARSKIERDVLRLIS
jgi:DNA topoisomerase IB